MTPDILHATTVAIEGRGLLIIGPSGTGKSSLALQLLALGGRLVADDRTQVSRQGGDVIADVPDAIAGQIEARHVGILNVAPAGPTPLAAVADLGQLETTRLPDLHKHVVAGISFPCLHKADTAHFPSAVLLYMKSL